MSKDYLKFLDDTYVAGEVIDIEESEMPYDDYPYSITARVLKSFDRTTIFNNIDFPDDVRGVKIKWLLEKGYIKEVDTHRTLFL